MKRQSKRTCWLRLGWLLVTLAALQGCTTGPRNDDADEPDVVADDETNAEALPKGADDALLEETDEAVREMDEEDHIGIPFDEYFGLEDATPPKPRTHPRPSHGGTYSCDPPPQPW